MHESHIVYIGLGSNAPDARQQLLRAQAALSALQGLGIAGSSPVYRTEPQDYADQPWFENCVLKAQAEAFWQPVPLMQAFLRIEAGLGRVRSTDPALRFGPRVIDIDMLLFDGETSDDPVCLLPHPRLTRRAFWLVPLLDIAPSVAIAGQSAREHLNQLAWRLDGDKIYQ